MRGRLLKVLGTVLAAGLLLPSLVSADMPTFTDNYSAQRWLDAGNRPERPAASASVVDQAMQADRVEIDGSLVADATDQLQPPIGGVALRTFVGLTATTRPAFLAVAAGLPTIAEDFERPSPAPGAFGWLGASSICRAGSCGSQQVIPGFELWAGTVSNPLTVGGNGVGVIGPGYFFGTGSSTVIANAFADGTIIRLNPPVSAFGSEFHADGTATSATVNIFSPTGTQIASLSIGALISGPGLGATQPVANPAYVGACVEGGVKLIGYVAYGASTSGVGNEGFDNFTFGNASSGPCAASAGVDPNAQLGCQVHLPILNFQGQDLSA